MAALEQIQARVKKLQAQAEALLAKKAQAAVDQIRKLMLEHGLTTEDIEANAKAKRAAKGLKVSGTTGKTKVVASGKDPVAPKYQHPKSGATWGGRGRALAWLAGAKDRSKFLIDSAAAVGDAKPAVKEAVANKTPTAKKTAAKKAVSAKVLANGTAAKKAPRRSVGVPAPMATVEPHAELTT